MPITRIPRGRVFSAGDVTKDILLGQPSVTLSNSSGVAGQEFYLVQELEGGTAMHRLYVACLAPGIPRQGSLHPVLNVPVASVRARFVGESFPDSAVVEVNYGLVQGGGGFDNDPDDPVADPQIEILSIKQPVPTAFDVNGNPMRLPTYLQTTSAPGVIPVVRTVQPVQGALVEVIEDLTTIIVRRRERASPGVGITRTHNNGINNDLVFADEKAMWHVNIAGGTDDGGDTWNVVYEFQRHWPATWHSVIVYTDPDTGLPAGEITPPPQPTVPGSEGNGTKVIQHYRLVNFRELSLPIFD